MTRLGIRFLTADISITIGMLEKEGALIRASASHPNSVLARCDQRWHRAKSICRRDLFSSVERASKRRMAEIASSALWTTVIQSGYSWHSGIFVLMTGRPLANPSMILVGQAA